MDTLKPGELYNKFQKKKKHSAKKKKASLKGTDGKPFVPFYGTKGGKMSNGKGFGGEKPAKMKKGKKKMKMSAKKGKVMCKKHKKSMCKMCGK